MILLLAAVSNTSSLFILLHVCHTLFPSTNFSLCMMLAETNSLSSKISTNLSKRNNNRLWNFHPDMIKILGHLLMKYVYGWPGLLVGTRLFLLMLADPERGPNFNWFARSKMPLMKKNLQFEIQNNKPKQRRLNQILEAKLNPLIEFIWVRLLILYKNII